MFYTLVLGMYVFRAYQGKQFNNNRTCEKSIEEMLRHLMQNKLQRIDAELEKHRFKCPEVRELNQRF